MQLAWCRSLLGSHLHLHPHCYGYLPEKNPHLTHLSIRPSSTTTTTTLHLQYRLATHNDISQRQHEADSCSSHHGACRQCFRQERPRRGRSQGARNRPSDHGSHQALHPLGPQDSGSHPHRHRARSAHRQQYQNRRLLCAVVTRPSSGCPHIAGTDVSYYSYIGDCRTSDFYL